MRATHTYTHTHTHTHTQHKNAHTNKHTQRDTHNITTARLKNPYVLSSSAGGAFRKGNSPCLIAQGWFRHCSRKHISITKQTKVGKKKSNYSSSSSSSSSSSNNNNNNNKKIKRT